MMYLMYAKVEIGAMNFKSLVSPDRPAEVCEGQELRIERLVFLLREVRKSLEGRYTESK